MADIVESINFGDTLKLNQVDKSHALKQPAPYVKRELLCHIKNILTALTMRTSALPQDVIVPESLYISHVSYD